MGAAPQVELLKLLKALGGCGSHRHAFMLRLAPPPHRLLRVRVVHADRLRLCKRNARPTVGRCAAADPFGYLGVEAIIAVGGDHPKAVHTFLGVLRDVLESLCGPANRKRAALEDALDVVAAHVEVGDCAQPTELYRRDVVRLRGLLLGTYVERENT